MKKSYISILLLFLVMILAISAASAAEIDDTSDSDALAADEATVDEVVSTDAVDDVQTATEEAEVLSDAGDGNNFTSLQTLIDKKGETVILDKDYVRVEGDSSLNINEDTTIVGGYHKIDAANLGGIFNVKSGVTLVLTGVTLVNGNSDYGGAIYNEGTVNIFSSELTDNSAKIGGAIYNKGIASISGSTLNGNQATTKGGAVYSEGTLVVSDSSFENNKISTGDSYTDSLVDCNGGGAIYASNDIRVTGSTFTKNTAPHASEVFSAGGAIYIKETTALIDDCTFNENSAVYGGAIIFEDFSQDTVAIKDSRFNNNQAWQGGAINGNDLVGSLIITGSNFTTNKATTPNAGQSSPTGGAIMVGSKSYAGIALDVAGCNFVENDGGYMGGAIASSPDNTIKVADSNFTGNFATTLGGAIVTGTGTELTVSGSTFNDNKVSGTGMGGAIFCEPTSKNNITGSNFTNNVDRYPSAIMSYQGTLDLSENTFTGTSIFNYAGTITSEINAIVLNNDTVETDDGNVALSARVTDDNDNVIRDSTLQFDINGVKVAAVYDVADGYYKATYALPAPGFFTVGIISSKNDDMTVKNGTVKNFKGTFKDLQNKINAATGTLDLDYNFAYTPELGDTTTEGIVIDKDLTINGNGYTISGNNAARIFVIDVFATVNLEDIVFANGAADYGGAIYAAGILNVDNCTFINNTAAVAGNAIYVPEEYTVYIIDSEESYNALLNDPASALNKYYIANPREDGIDADGNPVYDETTEIVGHSWLSAITADAVNVPDGKTKFPWILLNMNKFNGVVNIDFNGTHVFGPWNLAGRDKMYAIISVPASDDCNMVEYALEKGTGNADKKLDASLFVVKLDSDEFTTETAMDNTVSIKDSKFFDNGDDTDYAIYNLGKLALENNTISNLIYNEGELVNSIINITVMDNEEHNFSFHGVTLYAVVTDDNGNLITDSGFKFLVNTTEVNATYNPDTKLYEATYTPSDVGKYVVSMTYDGTATLIVKTANITFTKSLIDIQNMIDAAEAGDTIELTGDYAYVEEFDKGIVNGIVIDKAITIDGKGYTISGSDAARIFNVGNNAVLTLSNVTLTKGKAVNGGAVYVNAGATLNTDYVAFNENTATYRGGAIWSAGTANIDHSSFDNNNITYRAKNADNGGAAIFSKGNLNVDHSVFTNDLVGYVVRTGDHNNPQLIDGAVLSAGVAVINNSYFENNSGTYGAAITAVPIASVGSTSTSLIVENSEFVNNLAYNGAAINVNADSKGKATYSINNCTFIGNNATGIGSTNTGCDGGAIFLARDTEGTITNSRFYNNTAGRGGAIAISASKNSLKATIDNCEFINNTAVGTIENKAIGGAIRIGGAASADNMIVSVENSNFTNNVAADGGASIYNAGTLSLSGNNVTSGNAEIEVGAKGFITSTIKVTILDGEVKTIETLEAKLSAKVTDDKDNLIKDAQFKFTINDNEVAAVYNAANKLYEATYTLPSAGIYPVNITYASDDELEVENATVKSIYGTFTQLQQLIDNATDTLVLPYNFTYNAEIDGDALKAGVVIGKHMTVDGNGSTISGADAARIFQLNKDNINIKNTTFTNGYSNTSSQEFADWGGAIYSNGAYSKHVISDCKFYNNTAYNGGAIYLAGDYSVVTGCEFEDNNANASGGAIFIVGWSDTIDDSTFKLNMANELGGAVACYSTKQGAEITDSVFIGNTAFANGGAVSMQRAAGKITDSNFTGNAASNGGAVYWSSNGGSITGGEFIENEAVDNLGGAIFAEGTGLNITSTFTENSAENGGAIAVFKDATITESTFTNNTADNYGGAIYVNGSAKLDITKSAMKNNTATVGNSIYSNGTIGSTIVNATILDNKTWNDTGLGKIYELNATLTDDMGNNIYDPNFRFTVNGVEIADEPSYDDETGLYTLDYFVEKAGLNVISTSYNAANLQVFTGALDIPLANVTEFTVKVESIVEGENATVFVTLIGVNDAGLNAIVTVIVNNEDHAVNVVNGTGNITIDGLAHGQYPVVAMFEDPNYEPAINSTVFYVKGATKLTVESVEANYSDVITITVNLTDSEGNPLTGIVNVMGEDVFVENGVGTFTIDTQPDVGTYNLTAVYEGDNDYMNSSADFTVTVNVKELTEDDLYVYFHGDAPDNVTVYIEGPVGEYNVTVDGQTVTVIVEYDPEDESSWGEANITGLTPGVKVATITLDDPQYKLDENVSTKEFEYLGYPEYTVNITGTYPNAVINIEGPDGNYTVYIDEDHQYEITVKDGVGSQNVSGLFAGEYEAHVVFEEQDGYHGVDSWVDFTVAKASSNVTIGPIETVVYGTPVVIKYNITNETDFVTISISKLGSDIPEEYVASEGTITANLTAGKYIIRIHNAESDDFNESEDWAEFTVEKAEALTITVDGEIGVMGAATVNVTVADDATGYVVVDNDGVKEVYELVNGSCSFEIYDLQAGEYTINVTYLGDDNYNKTEATKVLDIPKSQVKAEITDVTAEIIGGQDATFTVTMNNTLATGTVSIFVDGVLNQVVDLDEDYANATVVISGLGNGTHTIAVQYDGDDNYEALENATTTITVAKAASKVTIEEIENVTLGNSVIIKYSIVNETEFVTISISKVESDIQEEYVESNGTITAHLPVGTYIVRIHNGENAFYTEDEATATFTVEKADDYQFEVNLTVDEIDMGENLTIDIELPEDANGNVTVYVDGVEAVNATVKDGKATVTVPASAFTKAGYNDIDVTYSDDNYAETTVSDEIYVNYVPFDLTASAANIEVGQNATIIVKLPENADGYVYVILQGVTYPVFDGKVVIENLTEGTYTATVTFEDDSVYADNETTVTFNVTKVKVSPEQAFNITAPENSTSQVISVNLPEDATGYLLLDINGTQTHVPLVNGKANVTVPNLAEGTYNATITYTGDDKYGPITTTKEINVTSNVPDNALNIPDSAKSDEPTTYSISLPSNATGYLEVDVDGTKYVAALNNGSASVTVPALSAGNHNVTVTYTGDANYSPVTKATTLSVTAPVFKLSNNKNVNVVYSAKANYKVLVTRDGKAVGAGQTVTFKFNGKTYTAKTDSKGYATLKLSTKVKVKKYTITATYKGVTVKNTVKVKHLIKAKNKKIKKSKKVNKIKVKTKKVNGKYLKGKKLTLKIKGKKVKAKINKKGVATFKLKKKVTKKLKAGKKYKYTVTYGKDKVTKKVKVKK